MAIMLLVPLFDKSAYTQQQIDWCAVERPLIPFACEPKEGDKIEVHFKEFEEDG